MRKIYFITAVLVSLFTNKLISQGLPPSDMLGRIIETRITSAGQIETIGDKYISGTYAVKIIQGKKTRQLKLIKISD